MGDGPDRSPGVGGLAVRGAAWNVAGSAASQALRFASKIVVARWLAPEDFAIAGIGLAILGLFQAVTVEGFAQALVRRKALRAITIDSVFWPLTIGALGLAGLLLLLTRPLAAFYDEPALSTVLPILGLGLVFGLAGAVPHALLQREFRFRAINAADLTAAFVTAVGGIVLAVSGFGHQALIAPVAAGFLARTAVLFLASRYRPSLAFAWSELSSVSRFGLSQTGSAILGVVNDNGDYLVMSRVWPSASFGQYYFAFERSRQPFQLLYPQLAAALFPSFAKLQDAGGRLRDAYLNATRTFALAIYPLHVWLLLLADPLLPWVFGAQWEPAVPIFRIFLCFGFVRAFSVAVPPLLLARDRAHLNLAFNGFRAALILPLLGLLAFTGAGVLTTAAVLLAAWTLQAPFYVGMALRQLGIGFRDAWSSMRRVVLSTACAGLAGLAARELAERLEWSAWLDVTACTIATGLVFAILNGSQLLAAFRTVSSHLRSSSAGTEEAKP